MYQAKLYVGLNCPKCKMTVNQLMNLMDIQTQLVKPEDHWMKILRDQGHKSFPVVQILKDGHKVDEWDDFQVSKIEKWRNKLS